MQVDFTGKNWHTFIQKQSWRQVNGHLLPFSTSSFETFTSLLCVSIYVPFQGSVWLTSPKVGLDLAWSSSHYLPSTHPGMLAVASFTFFTSVTWQNKIRENYYNMKHLAFHKHYTLFWNIVEIKQALPFLFSTVQIRFNSNLVAMHYPIKTAGNEQALLHMDQNMRERVVI